MTVGLMLVSQTDSELSVLEKVERDFDVSKNIDTEIERVKQWEGEREGRERETGWMEGEK